MLKRWEPHSDYWENCTLMSFKEEQSLIVLERGEPHALKNMQQKYVKRGKNRRENALPAHF